ncbi:class I SAM-dependent RNA methyltransferase [Bartonella krasnovii]|uniref:Class I SAM-dependent RNA methyltransferase n=1 Tax=Bartonella krasnovii TaxID=2267275 RepID=A0A5B9CZH5_9HYPH|nr:class I SAM-dependent RNA methyltransferase [Bartonella krasnovii]QEE11686.1 class I SAM-dependent RNA methyltransferase [Bartonella krasnovii]UNF42505.1 class I SAM-dependent RNA methyltransferase [Bartonella krasnovii]UNF44229.1 class I SAM-dependent RNA methyltransferase [Bartonella krasnovii]UNF47404.1 class I SAM-dependent RNA methyltransferase [Bartonella krasnovii]UNF48992.1 class I SAM-dependent RNA methyltransferase [Bartonella krasnovii]
MSDNVIIDHIGANGYGAAKTPYGFVDVPFTLPGECAEIIVHGKYATYIALKQKSPERIDALCQHFGECGGCALQHWRADAYRVWKRQLVVDALKSYGINSVVAPLIECKPYSRRRITLTASMTPQGQKVGFNRYLSHEIVAIEECLVSRPELITQLHNIRELCAFLSSSVKRFHVTITCVENGVDVALSGCVVNHESLRQKMINAALACGITRLSVDGEILIEREKPVIYFGDVRVEFPSGGFLQATCEAENIMGNIILTHFKKTKNALDLFSGVGTFTLRMAKKMNVHAVENNESALENLSSAARFSTGLKTVTCEKRDLFRYPLSVKELECFESIVFDPPRAGAEEQVRELAKATIPRIVAISCNPTTFARDLSLLISGGYEVEKVTPIDQFLWSSHVEIVAVLSKKKKKKGWKL